MNVRVRLFLNSLKGGKAVVGNLTGQLMSPSIITLLRHLF